MKVINFSSRTSSSDKRYTRTRTYDDDGDRCRICPANKYMTGILNLEGVENGHSGQNNASKDLPTL